HRAGSVLGRPVPQIVRVERASSGHVHPPIVSLAWSRWGKPHASDAGEERRATPPPMNRRPARYDSRMTTLDSRMTTLHWKSTGLGVAAALVVGGCTLLPTLPSQPPREPTPVERGIKPLTGPEVRALLGKAHYRWEGAQGASGTAITSGDGR